jgi:putative ribosome biogenesis GTPase RsgA
MWLRLIVILAGLSISAPGFAQSTDHHVLGTIMAIDTAHVEIKTTKGQSVNVRLNKQTRHKDQSNPKGDNKPAVGDRVVIKATKSEKKGDNLLVATEINFSSIKRVPILPEPVPTE